MLQKQTQEIYFCVNAAFLIPNSQKKLTVPPPLPNKGMATLHSTWDMMLVESGTPTASHQSDNGFAETEGFHVDENGQSVNDRDYKRDQEAQQVTRHMVDNYDQRAVQSLVIISKGGIVLSGNGRTMAGEIAARQGTKLGFVMLSQLKSLPVAS